MEGVTLIESGTSRRHFAFLKQFESAKNDAKADAVVLSTIEEVQSALSCKNSQSLSSASLASYLLVLLQCWELFPTTSDIAFTRPSIQFALVPTLQLAATAKRPKEILLAYTVLGKIFQAQDDEEQQQTSLLVLNTVRQHLEPGSVSSSTMKGKGKERSNANTATHTDPLALPKVTFALRSIISGVPSGPDIFPALYGPVSLLCHHTEEGIQRLALDALGKIQTYIELDESIASATWERTRGILSSYRKKKDGRAIASESLARSLLRSIGRAMELKVVGVDTACEAAMDLHREHPSPGIALACLDLCIVMIKKHGGKDETLSMAKKATAEACLQYKDSYSTLLSGTKLLGMLSNVDTSDEPEIRAVWTLIKSHLMSRNANRKLLALSALEAFLPYSWHSALNEATIKLDKTEMDSLMGMLGDRDESVRARVSDTVSYCIWEGVFISFFL